MYIRRQRVTWAWAVAQSSRAVQAGRAQRWAAPGKGDARGVEYKPGRGGTGAAGIQTYGWGDTEIQACVACSWAGHWLQRAGLPGEACFAGLLAGGCGVRAL